MFEVEFLGSTDKDPVFRNETKFGVISFCKSINWLQQLTAFFTAYRSKGDEDTTQNDFWYLSITHPKDKSNLLVFTEDIDEDEITAPNLCFVVVYTWEELREKGWLGKLFGSNEMKTVEQARHLPKASYADMMDAITDYVNEDMVRLPALLNYEGDPYDHS